METSLTALGLGLTIISKLFGILFAGLWIFILFKLIFKIFGFFGKTLGIKEAKLKEKGKAYKHYRSYALAYAIENFKRIKEDYYEDEIKLKPKDYREMAVKYLDSFVLDETPNDQMARILEAKVNSKIV